MSNICYEMEDLTQNRGKKQPGMIYLAVKHENVIFVSKMAISMKTAQDIMKFGKEHLNTYTVNEMDAKKIADIQILPLSIIGINAPYKDPAHGIGFYQHWHTYKMHPGIAHSFFGSPRVV